MKTTRKYTTKEPKKTAHLILRLSPELKQYIMEEATKEDIGISEYIRKKAGFDKIND